MKKKFLLTCLLASLFIGGCGSVELETYSNLSYDAFDTVFSYSESGTDQEAMAENYQSALSLWTYYNNLFDIYNTYEGLNNLKTINDNAGIAPVEVDSEIIEMLKLAKTFYEISNGEFDVTIGSLLSVWHTYREAGIELNTAGEAAPVPTYEELEEAAQYSGWEYIEIDEEASTVYITDENISLDVGGIAKGYAAQKIRDAIDESVTYYAIVNAGGNALTIHEKLDGSPWKSGVQDPEGTGSICVISLEGEMSVVTSGDYARYYTGEDGVKYHHIIDPSTLYPSTLYHSVTIVTYDSAAADCLSTALFTLSIEEGKKVLEAYEEYSGQEVEAIWIMDTDNTQDEEGTTHLDYYAVVTEGLEDSVTWAY